MHGYNVFLDLFSWLGCLSRGFDDNLSLIQFIKKWNTHVSGLASILKLIVERARFFARFWSSVAALSLLLFHSEQTITDHFRFSFGLSTWHSWLRKPNPSTGLEITRYIWSFLLIWYNGQVWESCLRKDENMIILSRSVQLLSDTLMLWGIHRYTRVPV